MTIPSVALPSEDAGGVDSDVVWGRLVLDAARAASKRVGALGTEHIITSRIGFELETRLGEITTVRLCASIRLDADRSCTSWRRSNQKMISLGKGI